MFLRSIHVAACTSGHYYNYCRIFHEVDPSHFTYPLPQWWATTWPPAPHHCKQGLHEHPHTCLFRSLDKNLFGKHSQGRTLGPQVCTYLIWPSYIRMPSNTAASVYLLHYRKDPGILYFHWHLSVSMHLFLPVS